MTRVVSRSGVVSRRSRWFGYSGVSLVKSGRFLASSTGPPLTVSRRTSGLNFCRGFWPRRRPLALAGDADRAGDGVAAAQAVLAHHVHRHVDVVGAGQVAGGPHERVVVEHVEDARDGLDDVVFAQLGVAVATAAAFAAGAIAATPAVTEASATPALPAVAVVVIVVVVVVVVAASLLRVVGVVRVAAVVAVVGVAAVVGVVAAVVLLAAARRTGSADRNSWVPCSAAFSSVLSVLSALAGASALSAGVRRLGLLVGLLAGVGDAFGRTGLA